MNDREDKLGGFNVAFCNSTHGASGYAAGSYWDGFDIVCGHCGTRIVNPRPTGGGPNDTPRWPDFILGERGKARKTED